MKTLMFLCGILAILSASSIIFTLIPYLPAGAPEPPYFKTDILGGFIGTIGFVLLWCVTNEVYLDDLRAKIKERVKKFKKQVHGVSLN